MVLDSPSLAMIYAPNGRVLEEGALVVQPQLGKTLALIASEGAQTFYSGSLATKILSEVNSLGGNWSAEDLARYTVREREPLLGSFGGYDIVTSPPPLSGGVCLLQSLNILKELGIDAEEALDPAYLHSLIESWKFVFNNRMMLVWRNTHCKFRLIYVLG